MFEQHYKNQKILWSIIYFIRILLIKKSTSYVADRVLIVAFNIASETSYVYIFSGQKLIKNAKNGPFWRVIENLKLRVKQCYQTG